jgi:hypothetical protein
MIRILAISLVSLAACGGKAKAPAQPPSAPATPLAATPAAAAARLAPTTRGELDASGSDEASWQRDRRVDLRLVN